ncbi:MAG: hypothetical protein C7B46_06430 [Sulfobacillus benefaciens]|uniref:Uncharacterized protein n=1 Tax=Sulfobacillus benefaciens TaxID=453960 RepID=A0A2T2XI87_9FIRM|nr:MAG: hypothetical protein C7B46_06430 [Sulfobacillus benefaciens]
MEKHDSVQEIVAKFFSEARDINPYASAATMRALDQVIRNTLSGDLVAAAAVWRHRYQEASAEIPAPSRDNPFPDHHLLQKAKQLKALADHLSQLASQVAALEAPSQDRVYNRIRDNTALLDTLIEVDRALAAIARRIEASSLATSPMDTNALELGLSELESLLRQRRQILAGTP